MIEVLPKKRLNMLIVRAMNSRCCGTVLCDKWILLIFEKQKLFQLTTNPMSIAICPQVMQTKASS